MLNSRTMYLYLSIGILLVFCVSVGWGQAYFSTELEMTDFEAVFGQDGSDTLWNEDPFPIQFMDGNYFIAVEVEAAYNNRDGSGAVRRKSMIRRDNNLGVSYDDLNSYPANTQAATFLEEYTGDSWTVEDPPGYFTHYVEYQGSYIQYLHLTPGSYKVRIGFLDLNLSEFWRDFTDEEWFNFYQDNPYGYWDEVEITVTASDPVPPLTQSIDILNLAEWMAWLPSAALEPGDPTPGITLSFRFNSDASDPMWARMSLMSTQLPARWTNDYLRSHESIAGKELTYYKTATSLALTDLIMNPNHPDNADWDFGFQLDSTLVGTDTVYWGTQLAVTQDPVMPGDTLSLRVSSRDFGADGWLRGELSPTTNDIGDIQQIAGNDLYAREIDGFFIAGLPLPRDEEVGIAFDTVKGDTVPRIYLGDGIGDAWEELYVDRSANFAVNDDIDDLQDSLIYQSILTLRPENDDSDALKNIFPEYDHRWLQLDNYFAYEDTLKKAGDGFRNLEKYRGLYGLLASSTSNDIYHQRLSPHVRNVIFIQYPIDIYDLFGIDIDTPTMYMNSSIGANRLIFMDKHDRYRPEQPNNVEIDEHYRIVDGMFSYNNEWEYKDNLNLVRYLDYAAGARELNSIFTVVKRHQKKTATFESYGYGVGRRHSQFLAAVLDAEDGGHSDSLRYVFGLTAKATETYGRIPLSFFYSHVFVERINYWSQGYAYEEEDPNLGQCFK